MDRITEALTGLCREGERVCNCGWAFETWLEPHESGTRAVVDGRWQNVGAYRCLHGCSSARIEATKRLAEALLSTGGRE
jgi:hypothetical protein